MKTYKFLAVALVATGFFSACTNEEVVEPINVKEAAEISFRLQGGTPEVETRALATTINNIEAFVVYGTDDVLASPALLFNGVTVARQIGTTPPSFTYAPKVYYSASATDAGFYAFSPVSAKIVGSVTVPTTIRTTGISFVYTVPAPDNTGAGVAVQEDLLVAGTGGVTPSLTPVSLLFKHALSRIFVTATNTTADPVIINELTLKNLFTTGTLSVGPASALSWTAPTTKNDYAYVLASSGVAVPGGKTKIYVTSTEQGMMVLPQTIVNAGSAADFALEVKYDFANLTNQTETISIPNNFKFEEGKQYTININFTGGLIPIEFTITVDPFGTPINEVNP